MSLGVGPEDPETVVLTKAVSSLQSGVLVNSDFIQGKLNYISGWTQFSGNPEYQSGHYLALKMTAPEGATTTVELIGGLDPRGPVELDSDMNIVVRIVDKDSQKIKVKTVLGDESITKIYSLSSLRLLAE